MRMINKRKAESMHALVGLLVGLSWLALVLMIGCIFLILKTFS